jgi:hypothetical protein
MRHAEIETASQGRHRFAAARGVELPRALPNDGDIRPGAEATLLHDCPTLSASPTSWPVRRVEQHFPFDTTGNGLDRRSYRYRRLHHCHEYGIATVLTRTNTPDGCGTFFYCHAHFIDTLRFEFHTKAFDLSKRGTGICASWRRTQCLVITRVVTVL